MVLRSSWVAALIIGIVLLVVGYNIGGQPVPLNQLEIVFGWIAILVAVILLITGYTGWSTRRPRL